ncbi:MAG TPA: MBL fold metallo-hydrolase [Candidatus Babeliales bacterium]|nr:MBL fold metallo-hydrolase [Candidatus Babeliales bacterium]
MPRPGGACSCYLVRSRDAAVVLELGSGAFAKLQLAIEYPSIDAIVVSHMHADHFFDLVPLRYGLKYGPLVRKARLPLWLPPGGRTALEALRRAVAPDAPPDFFDVAYQVAEYDPSQPLEVNDLRLTFRRTRHYVTAYAVRAECHGASITYSADTAPCDAVVELAANTSLFLCEAALGLGSETGKRGHSSAQEAGAMAQRAGAGRLALTHFGAAYSPEALVAAARTQFDGPVIAAADGDQFSVLGSSLGSEN